MKKILVIDDNADNLLSLKAMIADLFSGFDTYTATSGPEGIVLAKKHQPDLILLDILMPGMDGFEVCKILKEDETLRDIPVVFVTALKENKENKVRALEAGAEGFLTKPADEQELVAHINAMLKIKEANDFKKSEQQRLEQLVAERTQKLQDELRQKLELNKRLKESEERFRVAQEMSPDGFTILHPLRNEQGEVIDFTWVYENKAIAHINGTDPETVKGKRVLDLFPAHKGTSVFDAYISVASTGELKIIEEVYVGEIISKPTWLRLVVVSMGEDIAILSQDVTGRRQAEHMLRKSEQQLKETAWVAKVGGWEIDLVGNTLSWTDETFRIYELEGNQAPNVEEVILYYHPDDQQKVAEAIQQTIESGKNFDFEARLITALKNQIYVRATGHVVRLKGIAVGVRGMIQDITERKKAEEDLIKLSHAVEQSSVSIVITDAGGNIVYTNPWFTKITGYPSEEVMGRKMRIFSPGKLSETEREGMWRSITAGNDWCGDYKNRKKDGREYWESVIISPLKNKMGVITNFIAIHNDITDRKHAEEAQKQLEIAQKTARFKQDFLAKMSHEIRTPLAGVLGMIDVLEQTRLSDQQMQFVKDIKVSGDSLKGIINMVLEYSKIEAGKINITPCAFEFKALLENAKILYKDRLGADVRFIIDIDEKIPPFIKADKLRLSQVINNLVSNAVKFTQQGTIILGARVDGTADAGVPMRVKIAVCDTGKGMPANLQTKLFKPFVQSEEGERAEYEGTGLGLSICKELVELMQGKIGVESDEGKGSIFWFTFLAEKAEAVASVQTQIPNAETLKNLRVLLAEDMQILQKVTKLLLESEGHEVELANNGQHALDLFEPGRYDLILMDIKMPVMDGMKATRILKEKYTDLPLIIGLSANAFEGDREKFLALGMDEYLIKPFNLLDFNSLMSRLHTRS